MRVLVALTYYRPYTSGLTIYAERLAVGLAARGHHVTVLSLNSTESFGLVQVEAMLCGTPSIASNLPGVRQPPTQTGMGLVVPIGDSDALGDAILTILNDPQRFQRSRDEISARFSTDRTVTAYEALFQRLSRST